LELLLSINRLRSQLWLGSVSIKTIFRHWNASLHRCAMKQKERESIFIFKMCMRQVNFKFSPNCSATLGGSRFASASLQLGTFGICKENLQKKDERGQIL
jgi:hypothetical protein